MGWLDSNGLRRVWENIRTALAQKQDKLTGTIGQVVGFDAAGKPVAQSTASLVGPQGAAGKSAYQYAVEGGYTGTETAFKALMADAATETYVDEWVYNLAMTQYLALSGAHKGLARVEYGSYGDMRQVFYCSGKFRADAIGTLYLNPPPGYAFTGLVGSSLPVLFCNNQKVNGTIDVYGRYQFTLSSGMAGKEFRLLNGAGDGFVFLSVEMV